MLGIILSYLVAKEAYKLKMQTEYYKKATELGFDFEEGEWREVES